MHVEYMQTYTCIATYVCTNNSYDYFLAVTQLLIIPC